MWHWIALGEPMLGMITQLMYLQREQLHYLMLSNTY